MRIVNKCREFQEKWGGRLPSSNGFVLTVQMNKTYSSKWMTVQWTAYITSILTVQMDDGPRDRPCYVNLDRSTVQWTAYVTSIWTVQVVDGPMDRQCYANLDRIYYSNLDPLKLRLWTVILDCPKMRLWTVILEWPKLRLWTVILDGPNLRPSPNRILQCAALLAAEGRLSLARCLIVRPDANSSELSYRYCILLHHLS